ncbi:hypothetical protein LTR91_020310 [Friedmanniomyces endolithicus]|uniref:Uncharacterized protein n=1 Tax=Friedmanniomyces endolithicus TaxID=329885 RepID=A0AAN6H843_9PEZI|nr:hypothetical protein LTS09_006904 [Friedmanniomyces endolithicus]KAK0288738.1 hypothetical protein LTR35_003137 [Friedmanniomyces endolithicus]KAK0300506.1 hypothetical protein LTS00_000762 [Friedmanniomyces endolithicus]KAK0328449.1 hypothetical protein LTR82_000379 [Friedmanniomyces endolithicus]KAK0925340.1 hypothetical protein LTR57_004990 [Friedmanniomyces endolithicus]
MLQFVHVSGPEAGKDLQTRRKVRSQAMRDFRRRQREEKGKHDGASGPKKTTKSRKVATSASEQGSPRIQASRSRATSTTSSASRASYSRAASMTSSTPWISSIEHGTPDGSLSVSITRAASAPTYGYALLDDSTPHSFVQPQLVPKQTPEWPIPEHMYLTPGWMPQPTYTISRSPSIWGSDTEDYFQHAGHTPRTPQGFTFCHCCAAATLNPVLCDVCTQATYDHQLALATTWH